MELVGVFLHALNLGMGHAGFPVSLRGFHPLVRDCWLGLTPPGNKEQLWAESSAGEGEQMESCSLWAGSFLLGADKPGPITIQQSRVCKGWPRT